ncbi:MAG: hypothetical protein KatS3mg076_2148 [Candidatus Binatia bacterium]|nr:MAG: hypothetical protein KatS3mg076_2148 [Candidatus Binatia bacterium]
MESVSRPRARRLRDLAPLDLGRRFGPSQDLFAVAGSNGWVLARRTGGLVVDRTTESDDLRGPTYGTLLFRGRDGGLWTYAFGTWGSELQEYESEGWQPNGPKVTVTSGNTIDACPADGREEFAAVDFENGEVLRSVLDAETDEWSTSVLVEAETLPEKALSACPLDAENTVVLGEESLFVVDRSGRVVSTDRVPPLEFPPLKVRVRGVLGRRAVILHYHTPGRTELGVSLEGGSAFLVFEYDPEASALRSKGFPIPTDPAWGFDVRELPDGNLELFVARIFPPFLDRFRVSLDSVHFSRKSPLVPCRDLSEPMGVTFAGDRPLVFVALRNFPSLTGTTVCVYSLDG